MFIQGVKLMIMPFPGHSKEPFDVSLSPSNEKAAKLMHYALDSRSSRRDLASAVCKFIRECVGTILYCGRSLYELVYFTDPAVEKVVAFELSNIPPPAVVRTRRGVYEYVPLDVARQFKVPERIILDPDRVVEFKPPNGFRHELPRIMKDLASISSLIVPDFMLTIPPDPLSRSPFDVQAHFSMRELAVAATTRKTGWSARGVFSKQMLEYYSLHLFLRSQEFKIELRNPVLDTLNEVLRRAGRVIGFDAQIVVSGLPTLEDVRTAQANLAAGSTPFSEIVEPFLYNS